MPLTLGLVKLKNYFVYLTVNKHQNFDQLDSSAETERRFERASEFEHPKFSSEPGEFRAYLNLISIPIAEAERRVERASEFEHPNF